MGSTECASRDYGLRLGGVFDFGRLGCPRGRPEARALAPRARSSEAQARVKGWEAKRLRMVAQARRTWAGRLPDMAHETLI